MCLDMQNHDKTKQIYNLVHVFSVTELDKRIQTPSSIQKMTNPVDPSASSMMYQRLSNSKAHTMIPRRSHSRTRASPSTLS